MYKKQIRLLNEVIWLITMKMKLKIKSRSHRHGINKPRPRHGYKYRKYKMFLSILIVMCIKQHLRNVWSSIYEKVMQHYGKLKSI